MWHLCIYASDCNFKKIVLRSGYFQETFISVLNKFYVDHLRGTASYHRVVKMAFSYNVIFIDTDCH